MKTFANESKELDSDGDSEDDDDIVLKNGVHHKKMKILHSFASVDSLRINVSWFAVTNAMTGFTENALTCHREKWKLIRKTLT